MERVSGEKDNVLVIHCCATNYLQTQWLNSTRNIYYLSQFLWIRNSRMVWPVSSGLGSQALQACVAGATVICGPEAGGPLWAMAHLHAWQVGAGFESRPHFLPAAASPQRCSSVLRVWSPTSPRASPSRGRSQEEAVTFLLLGLPVRASLLPHSMH